MAFAEKEIEVAQILVQFRRLAYDSEIRQMFPIGWGSKKQRSMRKFADLFSSWKSPISFPNSNRRVTLKRKRSETRRQNSSRFCGTKGRSFFCAVNDDESLKKRNKVMRSSDSFLLLDLNLPPLIQQEEQPQHWHKLQEAPQPTLRLSAC